MSNRWAGCTGRWLLPLLLAGVGFGACGGKATDSAELAKADGVAGTARASGGRSSGGRRSGGSGGTYSSPDSVGCGAPAIAGEGGGGVPGRPVDLPGDAGASPCDFEHECGGCGQEYLSVVCSWGELELPWEQSQELGDDVPEVCRAVQQQYLETQGGGGASGAGGEAGVGGDGPVRPGACATYRAPGRSITSCGACTETADIRKAGQCNIGGECCVVVGSTWCGI